ncbi:MAG: LysR family transcriptional regulator [Verrucomicrobiales bacterium]
MFAELFSRSGLSLDRLRSFLAIADAGSIVRAALGDPVRQSLFSRQVRELEEFFGAELTRRHGKTIALSPAGHRLAELVRSQLQDLDDFRREQAGLAKTFTIASGGSMIEWVVVPTLAESARLLGGASLRLQTMRSRDLVTAVRNGGIDFALVREDALPADARRHRVLRNEFYLCVPKKIAGGKSAEEIGHRAFWSRVAMAVPAAGSRFQEAFSTGLERLNASVRTVVECHSHLQARALVECGQCAAVLPTVGLRALRELGVTVLPFAPLKGIGRWLVLHWNERQMQRRAVPAEAIRKLAVLWRPRAVPHGK